MASLALRHERGFTWDDYRRWPDDERWEVIGGEAFAMSPSPSFKHQDVLLNLSLILKTHFKGKACRPAIAPLDVKLSEVDVVQPDLMVICDPSQIKESHVEGAPTLVVEIVSPSSESLDRLQKMRLYESSGVEEYWIVTPYPPLVEIYTLESGRLHLHSGGTMKDTISSPAFPDLKINLADVFALQYTPEEMKIFEVKDPPSNYKN